MIADVAAKRGGKREGAGRPPEGAEARYERITFRLSPSEKAEIEADADSDGRAVGEVVLEAVLEVVRRRAAERARDE